MARIVQFPTVTPHPNKRSVKVAELISAATRLPLISVPIFLLVGVAVAGGRGILWATLCLLLTSGLSLLYLFYLVRSGKVRDSSRIPQSERVGPLRVVALLHVGAFLVSVILGAPAALQAILLSYAISTLLFALLAPLTNLSLHAAGVTGAAVCMIFVFGVWGILGALFIPPVLWARRYLNRHTPLELVAGVLAGGGGTCIAFWLTG